MPISGGAVGTGAQYPVNSTSMKATATGIVILGMQSGATTARGIAMTTTGAQHVAMIGTPTVTASQGGTWNIATVSTLLGTVSVSGGGGGVQYPINDTSMLATGTGTLVIGLQAGATTARGMAITTTGGLIIGSMPAVGGGQQYSVGNTALDATGTGTLVLGVSATTALALKLDASGALFTTGIGAGIQYQVGDTAGGSTRGGTLVVGVQSTTARGLLMDVSGGVGLGLIPPVYQDTSAFAYDGRGMVVLGASAGTAHAIGVDGSGGIINVGTLGTIVAGTISTVLAMPVLSASGITVASITAGTLTKVTLIDTISTVLAMPVLSATNITVASITTGSMSIVGGPTFYVPAAPIASGTGLGGPMMIGVQSGATTGRALMLTTTGHQFVDTVKLLSTGTVSVLSLAGAMSGTACFGNVAVVPNAAKWNATVIATTSAAAGVIILTSGANTIYITDVMVNVAGPMSATLCSATTAMAYIVGLATNGGWAQSFITPMICTTAQSFKVVCGSSGSCSVYAAGYTVT